MRILLIFVSIFGGIIILAFAISVLIFLGKAFAFTFPAWVTALLSIIFFQQIFIWWRIRYIKHQKDISHYIFLKFDGKKLNWHIQEENISPLFQKYFTVISCIVMATITSGTVIFYQYRKEVFVDRTWWFYFNTFRVPQDLALGIGILPSAIIILFAIRYFFRHDKAIDRMNAIARRYAKKIITDRSGLEEINIIYINLIKEIKKIEKKLQDTASSLNINVNNPYKDRIDNFLSANKTQIIYQADEFTSFAQTILEVAHETTEAMEFATQEFNRLKDFETHIQSIEKELYLNFSVDFISEIEEFIEDEGVEIIDHMDNLTEKIGLNMESATSIIRIIDGINELKYLVDSIKEYSDNLSIQLPVNHGQYVEEFIHHHKNDLAQHTEKLEYLVTVNIEKARKLVKNLEKANRLIDFALSFRREVTRDVRATGSPSLMDHLDYNLQGLTDQALTSLLIQQRFSEFFDILNSMIDDLREIKEMALNYNQQESYDDGEETTPILNDEQRAYDILGIPENAPNDIIKKAWKTLASFWHPDRNMVSNDAKMKEINWAYDYLRDKKGF